MSSEEDDHSKPHEATSKKLSDARKKGDIARSTEINTLISYLGFALAFLFFGKLVINEIGSASRYILEEAPRLSEAIFTQTNALNLGFVLGQPILAILLILAVPGGLILVSLVAQQSLIFAPSKIYPKASRISVIQNFRNKFGLQGLFEFAKSFIKLSVYTGVLVYYFHIHMEEILASVHLNSGVVIQSIFDHFFGFWWLVLIVAVVISAVDILWQNAKFHERMRMSHEELKKEMKDQEGDPHHKQQRKQRGFEIATNKMLAELPKANVVIVNPQHFAVGLRWDKTSGQPPVCIAKGVDEVAQKIKEVAIENAVPIHRDPPTARALFALVDINEVIPVELYQAVATAIRFADKMRAKARAR